MMNKEKLVIVLGSSATALAVVRELAQCAELQLIVASLEKGSACASNLIKKSWVLDDLDELIVHIKKLSQDYTIALIPSSDLFVEWISNHVEILSQYCVFDQCYSNQIALQLLDKETFSGIAQNNELPQPHVYAVHEFNQKKLEKEVFPVFIKPKIIHQKKSSIPGKKGMIIRNAEQWDIWYERYEKDKSDWIVQEIILGSEDNIMLFVGYIGNDLQLVDSYTARKLRQSPVGFGSASLVITEHDQNIIDLSYRLLSKIGYSGVCSGEFKWCNKRKQWVVIEFNPRPALWYSIATQSNATLVTHSILSLFGTNVRAVSSDKDIVLWRYGLKDMFSKLFYLKNKNFVLPEPNVSAYLKSNYKQAYPVFSLKDVKPFFVELRTYLVKLIKRLQRRK